MHFISIIFTPTALFQLQVLPHIPFPSVLSPTPLNSASNENIHTAVGPSTGPSSAYQVPYHPEGNIVPLLETSVVNRASDGSVGLYVPPCSMP